MATIQIKRKTSDGTGPLIGNGTVKAGEPLIDLNGGNLYIAKADKTNNLTSDDYIVFYNKENTANTINNMVANRISELNLKSASKCATGTTSGTIPLIQSNGKLVSSIIPKIAITDTFVVNSQDAMLKLSGAEVGDIAIRTDVKKTYILKTAGYSTLANWQELATPDDKVSSVNGKTGTVTISLSELGGLPKTTFEEHLTTALHLTQDQITTIDNMFTTDIVTNYASVTTRTSAANVVNNSISGALNIYKVLEESSTGNTMSYVMGIDSTKVLSPSSTIDGGTY